MLYQFPAHEMRNLLQTAFLAFGAIRSGKVSLDGATAAALDRSLIGLRDLVDRSMEDRPRLARRRDDPPASSSGPSLPRR